MGFQAITLKWLRLLVKAHMVTFRQSFAPSVLQLQWKISALLPISFCNDFP